MPWRLIIFVAIFTVFMVFVMFNLENRCDISFGFAKISDVPVFITIFTSFILGLSCAIPLVLHFKKRKEALDITKKDESTDPPDGKENVA